MNKLVLINLAIVEFSLFWMGLFHFIGFAGGWKKLAQKYEASDEDTLQSKEDSFRFCSTTLGSFTNYNNIVTVTVYSNGVMLSLPIPFHFGHKPLFFPWKKIRESLVFKKPFWGNQYATFLTGSKPITIKGKAARYLKQHELSTGNLRTNPRDPNN